MSAPIEHRQVAGSAGGPGECGAECACGVVFDGFDTPAEARELLDGHIADAAGQKLAGEQAAGLRALADFVENNTDIAVILEWPMHIATHVFDDAGATFATFVTAAARAGMPVAKEYGDKYAKVTATFSPAVSVQLQTDREEVCTRVVVGTETVTKKVKDPVALELVPEVEVSEEVEVVEWRCAPLLAAEGGGRS